LALQFGAARLPANVTAVIMIGEVLFASASAIWLGASVLTPTLLAGGALIVAASVWAVRR
jgi:drug/metabolite transporter (DMT)-like permease